jgi:dipeptidyl aminopeptidase/acylaminoacyl peptidase
MTHESIPHARRASLGLGAALGLVLALQAGPVDAQQPARSGQAVPMDPERAALLYVSNRHEDHPVADYERAIQNKARTDSIYRARSAGAYDFQKISYRSSVGDMDIPAYLFQPLQKRGARGHAAMIWVHGGVHGDWGASYLPFVKEAVERGYVVIAPEYRGSTGYGREHHNAIDYGGYEIDDVVTAVDYILQNLPHVDPDRIGIMGWSHGGFIAAHAVFRDQHPFQAAVAMVPVSNLIHRLSVKGPGYQRQFATQDRIRGLPFENPEEYIRRSPIYHVEKLQVPILVHIATNDLDVNYEEGVQMVWALRATKPDLAETKVYQDPTPWGGSGGHAFNRRVDSETLERVDSPEQIDSWNRTWAFLDWSLRPYEDRSRPMPPLRVR